MAARTLVVLALIVAAPSAQALDASLYTRHRFYAESLADAVTRAKLPFARTSTRASSELAYQLQVLASIDGRPADWLGLHIGVDSGLIGFGGSGATGNGAPIADHAKETLFLGETYAEAQLGEGGFFLLRAGKTIATVGDGAVFDGYALGVEIDVDGSYADADVGLFGRVAAHLPDATFTSRGKQSPLFDVEIGQHLGDEGEIALFGAVFLDGGDELAPIVRSALFSGRLGARCDEIFPGECDGERVPIDTSGQLGWVGARGEWHHDKSASIEGLVVLGFGGVSAIAMLPNGPRSREVSFSGLLASLEVRIVPVDGLELGGFAIAATGEGGFETPVRVEQTYHGYVGLSPRLPLTSIFFNGGLATTLQSPTVSAVSPNGSGLLAGGLSARGDVTAGLSVLGAAAVMGATHPSATGALYGVELDLGIDWAIGEAWALFASGAVFFPGNYYGSVPKGGQLIAGLSLALGD